jgi:hypothetical protein
MVINADIFDAILEALSYSRDGVRVICERIGVQSSDFYAYVGKTEGARERYHEAKTRQADPLVDEIADIEIESMAVVKKCDPKKASAIASLYRNAMYNRQWLVARLQPKRFGSQVDITSGGNQLAQPPTSMEVIIKESPDHDQQNTSGMLDA